MIKICNKCKIEKSEEEFSFSSVKNNKRCVTCKECHKKKWSENQVNLRFRTEESIVLPDSKICIYCKENKSGTEYHIDKTKSSGLKSYCKKCHMRKVSDRNKYNPKRRAIKNLSKRYRKIIKCNNLRKSETTIESLGCSGKFFAEYIEKQFKPGMTWENYGSSGWHIDHIRPWASIDLNNPEEVKICRHYTNLQPLWWWENIKKGGKW